jgi:hypothetical protein
MGDRNHAIAHEHRAGSELGRRHFAKRQHLGPAETIELDGSHRLIL